VSDLRVGQAGREQLGPSHDAVLSACDPGHRQIRMLARWQRFPARVAKMSATERG
jgi:hypothetical protein